MIAMTWKCQESKTVVQAGTAYDTLHFLRSWIRNPLRISAIAPSSMSLAHLMTREIGPDDGAVLELGPGTGVFTRALLSRGINISDLLLVEYGPEFIELLRSRFPTARIFQADAVRLGAARIADVSSVGAVVSGLPLLSMSQRKVMAILAGAFELMRPSGAFYQFTYGPRCPIPRPILDRLGLKATRIGGTFWNLPPASVYRISKRRALPAALSL